MKKAIFPIAAMLFLAACSGNQKTLLVLSNDGPAINEDAKTIVCKAAKGHEERTLYFNGDALKVSTSAGDATIALPDKGSYVINLKGNDTIIGSYQHFSAATGTQSVMSQDDLKKKIDSLEQLILNKNVTAANRNFFIPPNTGAKISGNYKSFVVAPYHPMTQPPETGDNSEPEVYQFYTINEVRDIIANLKKLTGETPAPEKSKK